MKHDHHIATTFKREFADWRLWWSRSVVIAVAAVAGLTVVAFTWVTERALGLFFDLRSAWWWAPLLWTPLCTAIRPPPERTAGAFIGEHWGVAAITLTGLFVLSVMRALRAFRGRA